ncbi:hypothetical protein A3754_09335 [Alcanivorax sp. HI0083]|uniref:restriction endonuclease subunit S n=1 Tax=unclassified Alcanivorax TaxID=2638842 RepID=UPI0007BA86E9|nr:MULTISPECIES: restriction endonuclease subunit S [unclassified Alcanivorax]KZY38410.1 hypothetical protein A3730_10390 [Alcanivorax sp. HI0044]KZZ26959.1 hypothetical protein A3754_09335 [Alcanivorax sp. HI0083]
MNQTLNARNACPLSTVFWPGELPNDWRVKRLKFAVSLISVKKPYGDSQLPYMGLEHIEPWTGRYIEEEDASPDGVVSYFQPGDVLFGKLRPYLAKVHLAQHHGVCSTEALVLRTSEELLPEYLRYFLVSPVTIKNINSSTYGSKMPRASWDFIGNQLQPLPPLKQQQIIAHFLDKKTAEIDSLIAKKRRLLTLLAEKRTVQITQAVTKGLNPDVAMKESGIEWLGEIPAHWETSRIKFFASVGNGSTPSRKNADYWANGSFPWLNSGVVNKASVSASDQFVTQLALDDCHLPIINPPAVLIGITGQGKTRGMATKLEIEATINQHLVFVKPSPSTCDVDYLHSLFEIAYLYLRNESDGGGSTKGAITCGQIENLSIPLPPISEQLTITQELQADQNKLIDVATKVGKVIKRLQEYRSALITNAVTGQIKVSGSP